MSDRLRQENGDILVVEREGVVAVMVDAWPVAITHEIGQFHQFDASPAGRSLQGDYAQSIKFAKAIAVGLELPVSSVLT